MCVSCRMISPVRECLCVRACEGALFFSVVKTGIQKNKIENIWVVGCSDPIDFRIMFTVSASSARRPQPVLPSSWPFADVHHTAGARPGALSRELPCCLSQTSCLLQRVPRLPCCGFASPHTSLLRKGRWLSLLWPWCQCCSVMFVTGIFFVPGGAKGNHMTSPVLDGKM